jgi:hypothetical protein
MRDMQLPQTYTGSPDLATRGFVRIDLQFSQAQVLQLYEQFDAICHIVEHNYERSLSVLDQIIDGFISISNAPLASETLKLKNIKIDEEKYKKKSQYNSSFNICSYQYLDGLYEYLVKSGRQENEDGVEFLKSIYNFHGLIKHEMSSLIDAISNKTRCATLLKIWRHVPVAGNDYLLPLHCDRSIFTIILHTLNSDKECLRIYPPTNNSEKLGPSYQPSKSDFPLLFPGAYAKPHFDIDPTPHCVVAPSEKTISKNRYSLVFFIARYEGW